MEDKYFLLVFNEDYGDEHDVPAIACMNIEEYNEWLETPSGELNENYESEKKLYDKRHSDYDTFLKELITKDFANKPFNQYTKDEKKWYDLNKVDYVSSRSTPVKCRSYMHASLGNSGDGFESDYSNLYLMKEFVECKMVKVHEVDKSFYDTFNKVGLSSISLCNIFNIED